MPSSYAHYRFGVKALEKMDPAVRRKVQQFRNVYDTGLHGPDIFFYYNPLIHTAAGALAAKIHAQTGESYFTAAARRLRLSPSEVGTVYLYGVLGHYCLDSALHPLVDATAREGKIGHVEMETEFDRFLLTKDRKLPPHVQDFSGHMRLSRGECVTVSGFYPGASPSDVHRSVKNMAWITRLLAARNRKTAEMLVGIAGKDAKQMLMPRNPNPNCEFLDEPMMALYDQALERYPAMEAQLTALIASGAPLGEEFSLIFG